MRQADPAASFIFFIFHFFVGGVWPSAPECGWQAADIYFTLFFRAGNIKSDLCVSFVFISGWMWSWRSIVPPSVTLHQQLIGAPLGSTVSLDCTIESSPSALHFWSRSDGTDLHEAAKYLMQSSSSIGPVVTPAMAGSSQPTWPAFRTQVKNQIKS
jgi:hypothetical protein